SENGRGHGLLVPLRGERRTIRGAPPCDNRAKPPPFRSGRGLPRAAKPAIDREAGVGELPRRAGDLAHLVPHPGGEEDEAVLLGRDVDIEIVSLRAEGEEPKRAAGETPGLT